MRFDDTYLKKALLLFVIYKVLVLAVGIAAYNIVPEDFTSRKVSANNPFLDPWAQLDARSYLDIAKNGYNREFSGFGNYAWFPLYPLLIRAFSFIGFELAAFLLANVFSLAAVVLMYLLVKKEFGGDLAYKSVAYLLFFPSAFFLTAMYTESLFLVLVLLNFYFAREGKWFWVGVAGFLASLTRPQGILMMLPMAYMFFTREKINSKALYLLLIPLGLFAFYTYNYATTGDFFAQSYTQLQHSRYITWPWMSFINTFIYAMSAGSVLSAGTIFGFLYESANVFAVVFITALGYIGFRYKIVKPEYLVYLFTSGVFPVFTNSLAGMVRFSLVIFPVFVILAKLSEDEKNRKLIYALYAIFIIGFILALIKFVNEDFIIFAVR